MRIEINPGDRQLAFILVFTAVVLAVSMASAYNEPPTGTTPASEMGHSADELNLDPLHIDWTNDRVGIGTTSPGAKVEIKAGSTGQSSPVEALRIWGPNTPANSNSAQDIRWRFSSAGSSGIRAYRGGSWDTYLQFLTNAVGEGTDNPQVRMHINQNGNVGIGTTSPSQKLEVNGNLKLSTANPYIYSGGSYIVIPNGLYVSGGTTYIQGSLRPRGGIYNDGASYLTISGGTTGNTYFPGNVGIGTTNPGTNKLEVVGGPIKATGGLIIETRTTNPVSPATGQMWLCTDPAPYCQ